MKVEDVVWMGMGTRNSAWLMGMARVDGAGSGALGLLISRDVEGSTK